MGYVKDTVLPIEAQHPRCDGYCSGRDSRESGDKRFQQELMSRDGFSELACQQFTSSRVETSTKIPHGDE